MPELAEPRSGFGLNELSDPWPFIVLRQIVKDLAPVRFGCNKNVHIEQRTERCIQAAETQTHLIA
jgi:hypothetical protein